MMRKQTLLTYSQGVLSNIEPTFYEFDIIKVNSQKLISFKADELIVIGTEESENWTTIK